MTNSIVGLSGGLGNQLFQITRGLGENEGHSILVDLHTSGSYFKNKSELEYLRLPKEIQFTKYQTRKSLIFLFNRCISTSGNNSVIARLLNRISRKLFSWVFTVLNGRKVTVPLSTQLVSSRFKNSNNLYFIGYFQTSHWASRDKVLEVLRKIEPLNFGDELLVKMQEISKLQVIAVHVRLGDYLKERNFGILTEDYYLRSLEMIDNNWRKRNIWIFSNDIKLAKRMLPTIIQKCSHVQFISEVDNSAASTWHLMRYAKDFIIGNSTFSWWSAFLRKNQDGFVCAPNPWFKHLKNPEELIPHGWLKLESSFVEDAQGEA